MRKGFLESSNNILSPQSFGQQGPLNASLTATLGAHPLTLHDRVEAVSQMRRTYRAGLPLHYALPEDADAERHHPGQHTTRLQNPWFRGDKERTR